MNEQSELATSNKPERDMLVDPKGRVEKDAAKFLNDENKFAEENTTDPDELDRQQERFEHEFTIQKLFAEQKIMAKATQKVLEHSLKQMEENNRNTENAPFTNKQRGYTAGLFKTLLQQLDYDQQKLSRQVGDNMEGEREYISEQNGKRWNLVGAIGLLTTNPDTHAVEHILKDIFGYAFGASYLIHEHRDDSASRDILKMLNYGKKLIIYALNPKTQRTSVEKYFKDEKIDLGRFGPPSNEPTDPVSTEDENDEHANGQGGQGAVHREQADQFKESQGAPAHSSATEEEAASGSNKQG